MSLGGENNFFILVWTFCPRAGIVSVMNSTTQPAAHTPTKAKLLEREAELHRQIKVLCERHTSLVAINAELLATALAADKQLDFILTYWATHMAAPDELKAKLSALRYIIGENAARAEAMKGGAL